MKLRFGIKPGDLVLMGAILLTALLLFLLPFMAERAETAEIVLAETGEIRTVSLARDAVYPVTARGVTLTVRVDGGAVFVEASDCRDGICRNTPPISRVGQSIVCAPAGVVVRIVGEEAIIDGISG